MDESTVPYTRSSHMIGRRGSCNCCFPCTCLFALCCLIPDIIIGLVYYYANRGLQNNGFSYYANQALQNRNISLSDYFGNNGAAAAAATAAAAASWKDLVDDAILSEYKDKFSNGGGDDDGAGIGSYISQYLAGGSWKDLVDDAVLAEYSDKFSNGGDDDATIVSYINQLWASYQEDDSGGNERYLRFGG